MEPVNMIIVLKDYITRAKIFYMLDYVYYAIKVLNYVMELNKIMLFNVKKIILYPTLQNM